MKNWQLLKHLDWPRFLQVFFFADISSMVIPAWALALRATGVPDGPALENLRQLSWDAQQELRDLLDDAIERTDHDASGPGTRC